jgi:hypothetical protein
MAWNFGALQQLGHHAVDQTTQLVIVVAVSLLSSSGMWWV